MRKTLRRFCFHRVEVRRFFSSQENNASIWSALSNVSRPCIVFTLPVVFALEIQPHDDPKTVQRRLRSPSLRQLCWALFLKAPCVDSSVALQASVNFQPRIRRRVDFPAADRSLDDLFPARPSVHGFLRLRLAASPFRVPGTGLAPQGRVGVSPETPGAGREKSLLSLRLQTT
ncbi:hypothetical protein NDU88_002481 [Pleurodeles waltl]|uniref:Uncharacterized protein n=1 Tax=Pleurodeles waltl TaxID=8319 RepID=A0AAV7KTQ0_PLEWA|nr:hypothetical protein NDU88_002481 [Pleurodeles waltl]